MDVELSFAQGLLGIAAGASSRSMRQYVPSIWCPPRLLSHIYRAWYWPQSCQWSMAWHDLCAYAGMVAETGEATAKYLRSVAKGEGGSDKSEMDKRKEAMAARGLKRVATMPRHSTAIQHLSTELVWQHPAQPLCLAVVLQHGLSACLPVVQQPGIVFLKVAAWHSL